MSAAPIVVATIDQIREVVREVMHEEMRASGTRRVAAEMPDVLTREQTAKLLQVHPKVVSRYVTSKGLRGKKIGRDWRFLRSDVLRWMGEREKGND